MVQYGPELTLFMLGSSKRGTASATLANFAQNCKKMKRKIYQ